MLRMSRELLRRGVVWMMCLGLVLPGVARAALTIEITGGTEGAQPIAVVPFGWQGPAGGPPEDISAIIIADLTRSGRFAPLPKEDLLARPEHGTQVNFQDWRLLGAPNLVIGRVMTVGNIYRIQFQLFDVFNQRQQVGFSFEGTRQELRRIAHQISDIIYESLTGESGAFNTRIAYITVKRQSDGDSEHSLLVADADGHSPQLIVRSGEPLMSPAWSPDGSQLAYVSFEAGRSMIYVQDVVSGRRQVVAQFKGINGAPAWSPDGSRLAMSLSKEGNSEIFIMHVASKRLQRLTNNPAIDTEPTWAPDGRHVAFTSDRGGRPQIYQVSANGGREERLTFGSRYNARPAYSPDGRYLTMVNGDNGRFRVAVLDLETKMTQLLTDGYLDESPSFAPNGSMIIYATEHANRGVLAAVSIDGRIKQRIALEERGDAREPAWGPLFGGK